MLNVFSCVLMEIKQKNNCINSQSVYSFGSCWVPILEKKTVKFKVFMLINDHTATMQLFHSSNLRVKFQASQILQVIHKWCLIFWGRFWPTNPRTRSLLYNSTKANFPLEATFYILCHCFFLLQRTV